MKKITLLVFLIFMCSCGKVNNGTKFKLKTFEKDEEKYVIVVDNEKEVFDFKDYVDTKLEWTISADSFGKETYLTKTVPLSVGVNEYFIIVSDESFTTYDCIIKRLDMYTISFDTSGGSLIKSINVQEGEIIKEIPEPTREGYKFEGWNYDFSKPIEKNLKLTANWTANGFCIINYNLNGGTGIEETIMIELADRSNKYPYGLNISKEGYYLDSWNTKPDGSGTTYKLGQYIDNPTICNITLYAIWKENELWDGVTVNYPLIDGDYYYVRRASELLQAYGKIVLLNDIDLNNQEWTPISSFKGELDGNNHKIKNMKITQVPSSGHIGFISQNKGLIKNLILDNYSIKLSNVNVSNPLYIGGLVGENRGLAIEGDGKIENCKTIGNIIIRKASSSIYVVE